MREERREATVDCQRWNNGSGESEEPRWMDIAHLVQRPMAIVA